MRALRFLACIVAGWTLTPAARAESPESAASSHVVRAVFATEIRDREPVGELAVLPADQSRVYFFTELVDLEGQTVRHLWKYRGETMADILFEVGGPRWRVYSSKNLLRGWAGDWTVSIVTEAGEVLHEDGFAYAAPEDEPADLPAAPDDAY